QRARAAIFVELGPLATEVAAELTFRKYSDRMPPPEMPIMGLDFTDPRNESTIDAWADSDIWITRYFGVYLRYQLQRVSADPPGLIYLRHLITFGPSLRWEGD